LLKSSGAARRAGSKGDIATLDVWDGHLATHGGQLLAARLDLVADLAPHLVAAYTGVAGSDKTAAASIRYKSSVGDTLEPGYGVPGGDAPTPRSWATRCSRRWRRTGRWSWTGA